MGNPMLPEDKLSAPFQESQDILVLLMLRTSQCKSQLHTQLLIATVQLLVLLFKEHTDACQCTLDTQDNLLEVQDHYHITTLQLEEILDIFHHLEVMISQEQWIIPEPQMQMPQEPTMTKRNEKIEDLIETFIRI